MKKSVWTILEIVKWGTEYFQKKEIDSPRLTIELLLRSVLGIDRVRIYTEFDRPLSRSELKKLREMTLRRTKREPLQYITGSAEFYGLELEVGPSVMIPRPETELLVDTVLDEIKSRALRHNAEEASGREPFRRQKILDICAGSGCISAALAKNAPGSKILAVDISKEALATAKKNLEKNNISAVELLELDILNQAPPDGGFDIIISNPPYIPISEYAGLEPEVRDYEPETSLTDGGDGLAFYRRFAEIFKFLLNSDGAFFLEIGFGQKNEVCGLFSKSGFDTSVTKDYGGIDRIIRGRRMRTNE